MRNALFVPSWCQTARARTLAASLTLLVGLLTTGCDETKDFARDAGSEFATSLAETATTEADARWYGPVKNAVIGGYAPGTPDHINADYEAIDYMGDDTTVIYPMMDGVVAFAGSNCSTNDPDAASCYGNALAIDHGSGLYSVYTHLRDIPVFSRGDPVTRDTPIGVMGETGCEGCGVHLHFVVRRNSEGLTGAKALFEGTPVPIRSGQLSPR